MCTCPSAGSPSLLHLAQTCLQRLQLSGANQPAMPSPSIRLGCQCHACSIVQQFLADLSTDRQCFSGDFASLAHMSRYAVFLTQSSTEDMGASPRPMQASVEVGRCSCNLADCNCNLGRCWSACLEIWGVALAALHANLLLNIYKIHRLSGHWHSLICLMC